jgi:iron(III) transport system substrate-binding protein
MEEKKMKVTRRTFVKYAGTAALASVISGCLWKEDTIEKTGSKEPLAKPDVLTVYSGRGENLIGPLIERLERDTGIDVQIRYGKTAGLAATILEEGKNSPADLFFAQDAGALGALSKEGRLLKISNPLLNMVEPRFESKNGEWIGITGRARTVDYNTLLVNPKELPDSIWGFTDTKWAGGKIGWAPTNGSFQSFITAFRVLEGEDRARKWLEGIIAGEPQAYSKNTPILAALGRGEVQVGFVNNYYLHRFKAEDPDFPVAHHYTRGDAGSMINVAGLGIVDTARNVEAAERFIGYMLSEDAQRYYATSTYEYPLLKGIKVEGPQKPLSDITTPDIDLSDLDDLKSTLDLLRDVGVL